jgi:hypothetical protein
MRALLREVLEDQFSLEARLPRSLAALLSRPGKLTSEYAAGRIARYLPPFRLYLLAGLLFFVTLSFVVSHARVWGATEAFLGDLGANATEGATIDFTVVSIPIDSLRAPAPLRPLARRYVRREAELNAMPPREAVRIAYGGMIGSVSAVVFLLVPAFALLLKALHPRRLYTEHFVFFLHLHAAAFLLGLLPLLVQRKWIILPFLLWLAGYLFLALRRVYGSGWLGTAARWGVVLVMYGVALMAVFLSVIVITVLTY